MPISTQDLDKVYLAYFGRPADFNGQTNFAKAELSDVINAFDASAESKALYGTDTAAKINAIYLNLFNRAAEPAGLVYWVNQIAIGAVSPAAAALQILNQAVGTDATAVANKLTASAAFVAAMDETSELIGYAGSAAAGSARAWLKEVGQESASLTKAVAGADAAVKAAVASGASSGGSGFTLTDGRDNITGTAADDTFYADAGQNQHGTLANALSTGDVINGGAGHDKIVASVMRDGEADDGNTFAINPRTDSVEEVRLEALNLHGSNKVDPDTVIVDAGRMSNVEQFWSDNSSAHLNIQDVRLGNKQSITKDITFGLKDVDFKHDFKAYFDSASLKASDPTAANSQLLIRIADVSTATPLKPLANVNLNLSFKLGTETVTLANLRSTDGTYDGLRVALDTALTAAGYPDVKATLSTTYSNVTVAGNTVTLPFVAQEILLKDPSGKSFSAVNFTQSAIEPVADGFLVAGNAAPVAPTSASYLIESNLVLDNAGRTSLAGDVEIGGMSNSNKGIEKFNVTVDRSSKITSLQTTGTNGSVADGVGTLKEIIITSKGAKGDLWIGGTEIALNEIDANGFEGKNLSLGQGQTGYGGANAPIQNLKFLDAGNTAANVTFVGNNNGTDAKVGLAAKLQTGAGNDTITLHQYGISKSGSTPASVDINAGEGNNTITLSSVAAQVNTVTGKAFFNTANVVTGSGVDKITGGSNALTVNSGAGNDVIYADNTGNKGAGVLGAGASTYATTKFGTIATNASAAELLFGRTIKVTLDVPAAAAVASTQGFEIEFKMPEVAGQYLTTELALYQAVAKAINDDNVLSDLATASVDSKGQLVVQYKIDGVTVAGDDVVQISSSGTWASLSSTAQQGILKALQAKYHNSALTAAVVTTAYDTAIAATVVDAAATSVNTNAVFTVTLGTAAAAGETITLTLDGVAAAPIAAVAGVWPATVVIGGVTYDVTGTALGSTAVTFTAQTPANLAAVTATSTVAGATSAALGTPGKLGLTDLSIVLGTTSTLGGGDNVVTAGAGDDVIVLSSNTDTADKLKFETGAAGAFGKDAVVYFETGADATNGADTLDFTAFLNNKTSASGSVDSEVRIATAFTAPGGDTNINANEVNVVNFGTLGLTAGVTLEALTDVQLKAALATAGGWQVGAKVAGFVGTEIKSIMLVAADNTTGATNMGQYKVFEVSGTAGAAVSDAFTTVQLLGTLDFGKAMVFTAENMA